MTSAAPRHSTGNDRLPARAGGLCGRRPLDAGSSAGPRAPALQCRDPGAGSPAGPLRYVELHAHSAFSFRRAGSSVEALATRAAALGMSALALTDYMTLAGVVRFQAACARHSIKGIVGCELAVADPIFGDAAHPAQLVVLAEDQTGYARLCQLLTDANLAAPDAPVVPFAALAEQPEGLIVLTGGREGTLARLLLAGQRPAAEEAVQRYAAVFGPRRVCVELQHQRREDDVRVQQQLVALAERAGLRCVLANGVYYATRDDYPLYDLLTCVRLGLPVDTPHPERPVNDEAYLADGNELVRRCAGLPWAADALAASAEIAARCDLALLKATCTAPRVPLAAGETPASRLRALCERGLRERYGPLDGGYGDREGREVHAKKGEREGTQSTQRAAEFAEKGEEEGFTTEETEGTEGETEGEQKGTAEDAEDAEDAEAERAIAEDVERAEPWEARHAARRQLEHELAVIGRLELEEFFLVVADIMRAAREMGIRVSGRGSAANSLAAYCLGITGVDPIRHRLLFERFLNPDRVGMPDIDIDVQSDRREELIRYVERTYTLPDGSHAAMVANVITYRPRLALRDAAKALGYALPLVDQLTKVVAHHAGREALAGYEAELAQVITRGLPAGDVQARCVARLPLLLRLAARLCGLPRHLSLHNGGMVLTRAPLAVLLPVRVSANGVRALEVDKDDVERLGLIKFDLLGLRTLGAVEEALALIEETTGARPDIDALPTDPPDAATMRLVRAGQTLAVFQIESPGQWHMLAQTQPRTFDDLIVQTALFRPGPIQGGFVHPYIERRQAHQAHQARQRDAVQAPWHATPADDFWTHHPVLGPILHDTEGILLFQEQILEIAHCFAGLSYAEADGFRRAMSHAREPEEMEAMRARFVGGAVARGERMAAAERVFGAISAFVGYGFCRSHAAEFGRTIYQTAYLKAHWPAHYLAAFLSSQPAGFFPPHVVLEEAKQLGIPVLRPDINRGEDRFTVERVGTPGRERWAIRIGLRQVARVGEELAEAILWEQPFTSLHDVCARLRPAGLDWPAAAALVLAGACDSLAPHGLTRRQRLWQLHELWQYVGAGAAGRGNGRGRGRGKGKSSKSSDGECPEQLALTWPWDPHRDGDAHGLPALPAFSQDEAAALDYELLGMSARPHPMRLMRRELRRRGVRSVAELMTLPAGRGVRVAGWAISAQRPPTAHGMGFVVLEDETGRVPVALPPRLAQQLHRVLRSARVVSVTGRIERVRWYRSLLAVDLQPAG